VASNDDKPNQNVDSKGDIGEAINLVKAYAKQETIDPLRSVGSYLAWGVPGALLLAVGWVFLLIAMLRALQTELHAFDHGWSFVPYLAVVAVGGIIVALFVRRVMKRDLRG
jgi:cytochrome c-type biogenesis protein CcmH/NrfF